MTLPSFDDLHSLVPPRELLDFIAKRNKNVNYTLYINTNNNTAERIRYPPTSIKIYESNKDSPNISPTLRCGNSMVLDTFENLCGNAIWSYVVGSTDTSTNPPIVDFDNGFLVNIHSYIGLTYFLPNDEYNNFIREIQDKQSPVDIINWITILIETNKNSSGTATATAAATVTSSSPATTEDELHEKLRDLTV